jgi:hypothetical protein
MTGRATHGHTRGRKTTPEFNTWLAMRQRCHDQNHAKYPAYGAKGIRVCERWRESFEAFLEDMGPRPKGMTLDRKENALGYEPSNCRWATPKEQAKNRRAPKVVLKTHCPSGHPYSGTNLRITKSGKKCKECERLRAAATRRAAGAKPRAAYETPLIPFRGGL